MPAQHDTGRPARRHRAPPRPSSTWRPDSGCATGAPLPCSRSAPAFSPSLPRQTAASGCRASRVEVVEPMREAATVPPLAAEAGWPPETSPFTRRLRGGGTTSGRCWTRGGGVSADWTLTGAGFVTVVEPPGDPRPSIAELTEEPNCFIMVLMLVLPAWGFVATPAVIRSPAVPLAATALCVDGGVLSNFQAWLPTIIVGIAVQQYAFKARRHPPPALMRVHLHCTPTISPAHLQANGIFVSSGGRVGQGRGGKQGSGRAARNASRRADSELRVRRQFTPASARLLAGEWHLRLEEGFAFRTLRHG